MWVSAVWGTFSHTRQSCTVVVSVSLFWVDFFLCVCLGRWLRCSSRGALACLMWGWSPEVLEQHQTEEDDKMEGGRGCRKKKQKRGNGMVGKGEAVQTTNRLCLSVSACHSSPPCLAFPFVTLFFSPILSLSVSISLFLCCFASLFSLWTGFLNLLCSALSVSIHASFYLLSWSVLLTSFLSVFLCLSLTIIFFIVPSSFSLSHSHCCLFPSFCLVFCLPIAPLALLVFHTIIFCLLSCLLTFFASFCIALYLCVSVSSCLSVFILHSICLCDRLFYRFKITTAVWAVAHSLSSRFSLCCFCKTGSNTISWDTYRQHA